MAQHVTRQEVAWELPGLKNHRRQDATTHHHSVKVKHMKSARIFWIALFTSMALIGSKANADTPTEEFSLVVRDIWEYDLAEQPLSATHYGDHRYNDQLDRVRVEDHQRRRSKKSEFYKQLQSIRRDELKKTDRLNYDLLLWSIQEEINAFDLGEFLIPITNRSGFHIYFPDSRKRMPLKTVADFEDYIARLSKFKRYANDHIELMRTAVERGYTLPGIVISNAADSIEPHIVGDPTKSLMYQPFRKLPNDFSDEEAAVLREKAKVAIKEGVVAGYKDFLGFMQEEYLPAARTTIAASALPNGREYYRWCVRHHTTLDLAPEQIHQIGLNEVKRIREEMATIMKRVEFEGSFEEFVAYLRTDEKFYAKTPEDLLQFVALILKRIDGKLPKLFRKLPRTPYGLIEIPSYIAPQTTAAYYMQPSGDGSRAGFYYINTYDLKSRPLYGMEALSLHEAVPGHHLQLALQQELTDIPEFRRFMHVTAFIEGWALYAERLGLEMGFFEDPYQDFGRLNYEIWRACRLVVDTGIHQLGWTREQAIEFMAKNSALSMLDIRNEVDRYIAWPGQALAYKMGELKIRELRQRAEKRLGKGFDIREFHDVVLRNGAVPLTILEKQIDDWLLTKKAK